MMVERDHHARTPPSVHYIRNLPIGSVTLFRAPFAMKVVVIGGYGVFGSRLVRLLLRDGHDVVIAGRNKDAASALAASLQVDDLVLDRRGDLGGLWAAAPEVVIDAAGPFQISDDDPYWLPREAISHGVHYLDLSDDADFCAGISALDQQARAAHVFVLSGASSVPAISSAVVRGLTRSASGIDSISTAILPGNRAPRGRSVVTSILRQCGQDMQVIEAGQSRNRRGWSQPQTFDLGQGITRRGWMIAVPDQRLFPAFFDAATVTFHAGLELPIMNRGLAVFSWLRAKLRFGVPDWLITAVIWLADRMAALGSDAGGMVVDVIYHSHRMGSQKRRAVWRLLATDGDGPFIPAVAARAILRTPHSIDHGARPALAEVALDALEDAMRDLAVTTETSDKPVKPLFQSFLKDSFQDLPDPVRAGHAVAAPLRLAGRSRVTRGTQLWARVLARAFGFPPAGDDVPVTVTMFPQEGGEWWERRFGDKTFWSFLKVADGKMTERFAPFTFTLGLHVADGQLFYPVASGRLGPIRLPKWCLPVSTAREFAKDGRFHFDVALRAPLTGALMVHYQGWLAPDPVGTAKTTRG